MGTALDRFLRGNKSEQHDGLLKNCLFRESLDIEDIDKEMFDRMSNDKTKLIAMIKKMFRPHGSTSDSRELAALVGQNGANRGSWESGLLRFYYE